jgi:hypothetical protein
MDKSQRQRGKYLAQLLGGTALVVIVRNVLQTDSVIGNVKVTISILGKESWQNHVVSLLSLSCSITRTAVGNKL